MDTKTKNQHLWVGRCGCYSDIQKASQKPWFYKPQWYWFGPRTLLPISLGNDEWCRYDLVIGFTITGRMIIPLWGHSEKTCGECPRTEPHRIDDYLVAYKEIDEEQAVIKARAIKIKEASKNKK